MNSRILAAVPVALALLLGSAPVALAQTTTTPPAVAVDLCADVVGIQLDVGDCDDETTAPTTTTTTVSDAPTSTTTASSTATATTSTTTAAESAGSVICNALTPDGVRLVRGTDTVDKLVRKLFGADQDARPSNSQIADARQRLGCGALPDQDKNDVKRAVCKALTVDRLLDVARELRKPSGVAARVEPIARYGLRSTVADVRDDLNCDGGGKDGDDDKDSGKDGKDGDDGKDGKDGKSGSSSSSGGTDSSIIRIPSGAPATGGA